MTKNCRGDPAGNISRKILIKTRQLEHKGFLLRQPVLKVRSPDQQYQHHHHQGTGYKCKFGAPTIDLVIQRLWGWDLVICVSTALQVILVQSRVE